MHEVIIDIICFVVAVCGFVLTGAILPYIQQLIKNSKYSDVYDIVETAVQAAEQKCKTPKQGKAKKAEVYSFVSHWLDNEGIKISEDEIDRIIESAVWCMNNGE